MTALTQDHLVSVRHTAATLDCSVATVWRRVADKTIPQPIRIGGMTRWSVAELAAFIEEAKAQREAA